MTGHAKPPRLADHDANTVVHHLDPAAVTDDTLVQMLTDWLDSAEKARMQRFVQPRHQHAFLVSHALVRKALADTLGCHPKSLRFEVSERGKPVLTGRGAMPPLHFNLSHTDGRVAVAIDRSPLGLDIEWLARPGMDLAIADRYFTRREHQDILDAPVAQRKRRFLTYWTLKEAYLKAEGWGIVDGLDTFEFALQRDDATGGIDQISLHVLDPLATPSQRWLFWHTQAGAEHLVSVAVALNEARPQASIHCRAWQPGDWS